MADPFTADDMPDGAPVTAAGVTSHLLMLSKQLGDLDQEIHDADVDAAHKREDYNRQHSKAFLEAEGAMEMRKHEAILATSEARIAAELAERMVKNLKGRRETLRMRIDVGRTASAALRAEVSLAQHGGTT